MSTDKKKKEKKEGRIGFFHSIRFAITLLVMISVCLTTVLNLLIVVPATKEQLKQSVQSNMLGLAGAYGEIVQNAIDNGATVNANLYKVYKIMIKMTNSYTKMVIAMPIVMQYIRSNLNKPCFV